MEGWKEKSTTGQTGSGRYIDTLGLNSTFLLWVSGLCRIRIAKAGFILCRKLKRCTALARSTICDKHVYSLEHLVRLSSPRFLISECILMRHVK